MARGSRTSKGPEAVATLACSRTVEVQINWNKDNEEEHCEIKPETKWGA